MGLGVPGTGLTGFSESLEPARICINKCKLVEHLKNNKKKNILHQNANTQIVAFVLAELQEPVICAIWAVTSSSPISASCKIKTYHRNAEATEGDTDTASSTTTNMQQQKNIPFL